MKKVMKKYLIGEGAFGKVYRFQYEGQNYAIKKIKIKDTTLFNLCVNQIQVLQKLANHRNIVNYIGHEMAKESMQIYLAMEYIQGQSLGEIINKKKSKNYTENQYLNWVMQMSLGLNHLRKHNILHLDIKPDNIMLDVDGVIKIIDFGLSQVSNGQNLNPKVGTPIYMSPQMVQKNYSYPTDIWSFGVTFYQLVTGKLPFQQEIGMRYQLQELRQQKRITQTSYGHQQSYQSNTIIQYLQQLILTKKITCRSKYQKMNRLISLMLIKDPFKRITPEQILMSPQIIKHLQLFIADGPKQTKKSNPTIIDKLEFDPVQKIENSQQFLLSQNSEQFLGETIKLEKKASAKVNYTITNKNMIESEGPIMIQYQALQINSESSCCKDSFSRSKILQEYEKTAKLDSLVLGINSNLKQTRPFLS